MNACVDESRGTHDGAADRPSFVELDDKSEEVLLPDKHWLSGLPETAMCRACGHVRPHVRGLDVVLSSVPDSRFALAAVIGPTVPVAHVDFLDALGPDLVRDALYLGKVTGPGDVNLAQLRTVRGRECLFIRGKTDSMHSICEQCGRLTYWRVGSSYLTEAMVRSGASVYEENGLSLILSTELSRALPSHLLKLIKVFKLPVIKHAKDALPDDITCYPTQSQRVRYQPTLPAGRM